MSISNYNNYRNKINSPTQQLQVAKTTANSTAGQFRSYWMNGFGIVPPSAPAAALPSTSTNPSSTMDGAFAQNSSGSFQQRMWVRTITGQQAQNLIIMDRLSHVGGIVGNVATPQTVNTAALTRYTNGDGVWAALEIGNQIGVTSTTVTISYTNSQGVAGRTSQPIDIGNTGRREAARWFFFSLQEGDTGVRSVETLTFAATTGTAGDCAVVLVKPLLVLPNTTANYAEFGQEGDPLLVQGMYMPVVQDGACLFVVNFVTSGGNSVLWHMDVAFLQDDDNS